MSLRFRFAPHVGYMTTENEVAGGNKMIGPMFIKVGNQTEGSGTYSVQDITPVGENIPNGEDPTKITECLYLQALANDGSTDGSTLFWRDGNFKSGKSYQDFHGWYTSNGKTPAAVTLKAGEGIWCYCPKAGIVLDFPTVLNKGE